MANDPEEKQPSKPGESPADKAPEKQATPQPDSSAEAASSEARKIAAAETGVTDVGSVPHPAEENARAAAGDQAKQTEKSAEQTSGVPAMPPAPKPAAPAAAAPPKPAAPAAPAAAKPAAPAGAAGAAAPPKPAAPPKEAPPKPEPLDNRSGEALQETLWRRNPRSVDRSQASNFGGGRCAVAEISRDSRATANNLICWRI